MLPANTGVHHLVNEKVFVKSPVYSFNVDKFAKVSDSSPLFFMTVKLIGLGQTEE